MLERDLQRKVVTYARALGILCFKFSAESQRNVPDFMYLYSGRLAFVEFKRPGAKPRKAQLHMHDQLRRYGFHVAVIDDVTRGKAHADLFHADALTV